jgi:hypothetical protein
MYSLYRPETLSNVQYFVKFEAEPSYHILSPEWRSAVSNNIL